MMSPRFAPLVVTVSQTCFLLTLTVLRHTGQVFCTMSLKWDLSDVFLMIRLGLMDIFLRGEETNRGKVSFSSHYIKYTVSTCCITVNVDILSGQGCVYQVSLM